MKNSKMRISAIVTTFNRAEMLRDCIESLLFQTLDPDLYEIVIVDNNSIDATRATVEHYKHQSSHDIRYVFEPRQGLQHARNTGAKTAESAILAYTDDDAICDKHWLEALLKVYDDKQIGCAGGKIIVRWDEEPPLWVLPFEDFFGQLDEARLGVPFRILQPDEYVYGGNLSIRKSVLFDVGGFNPDQKGGVLRGDAEMGLLNKLHKKGVSIAWVPDAVVWHVQTVGTNATLSDMKRRFRNWSVVSTSASYKKNPYSGQRLFASSILSLLHGVRAKTIALFNRTMRSTLDYPHELWGTFFWKQAIVKLDLAFSRKKREMVLREDWLD